VEGNWTLEKWDNSEQNKEVGKRGKKEN